MRCFVALLCLVVGLAASAEERLVVFVDGGGSGLQAAFAEEQLPALRAMGEGLGLEVVVFDVAERGVAPEGVGITPLIAFQNWRGTSIYQGRYATLDRVLNFVRTSRFMPQGEAALVREHVPVWDRGAVTVAIATKITDFVGPGLEHPRFMGDGSLATGLRDAVEAASAGGRFELVDRVELGRSDRTWYVDLYPYVAEDGTVFVSSALFSQFHCHEPVKSWTDEPTQGNAGRALMDAMVRAEAEIVRQIGESALGDGFDVVDEPSVSWAAAGLGLPSRPAGADVAMAEVELAGSWVVDVEAQEDGPAVQFTWPAPVDAYSGEASEVTGTLALGGDAAGGWTLSGMSGEFVASTDSVTMGESDLDAYIHSGLLEVGEWPEARFVFDRVAVDAAHSGRPVELGALVPATVSGTFTMKGVGVPLSVPMSVESFVGEDGRPRLVLTGRWSISLSVPWGFEGPPGPKEASDSMLFACRLVLEPSD